MIVLPKIKKKTTNWEIQYYGADKALEKYINKEILINSNIKNWTHGWVYEDLWHYRQIVGSAKKDEPVLVHTKTQKKICEKYDFSKVYAIGAPYIYCPNKKIGRERKSLLIMPPHVLKNIKYTFNLNDYLIRIKKFRKHYILVAICLHQNDFKNRRLINICKKNDLLIIAGASGGDENSLLRMKQLFTQFETMTSPVLGSHFVYAGFEGCKLSWHCKFFPSRQELLQQSFYKKNPYLLDFLEKETIDNKKKYEFLECSPLDAKKHLAWAKKELGFDNKKSAKQIERILINKNPCSVWQKANTALRLLKAKIRDSFEIYLHLVKKKNKLVYTIL